MTRKSPLSFAAVARFSFHILCSVDASLAVNSFHNKLLGHKNAADKAFHDNLRLQLAASKHIDGSNNVSEDSSPKSSSIDLVSASLAKSLVVDAVASFQIYLNSTLPANPAPPEACATALMASISCNETITLMGISPIVLLNDLPTVCTPECTSSLVSYRANVVSACQKFAITSNNVTYPPTYILDSISGPYNTQCLQDPSTAQFCSPLLSSFNSSGGLLSLPTSELCTFCTLETLNVTLSNPATFSVPLLDILSSAVDTCGSDFDRFNVSAPPSVPVTAGQSAQFGSNSTAPVTSDCLLVGRNITTSAASDCAGVAAQFSVSYNDVLSSNPLFTSNCSIPANTDLCVPQTCTTYTIQNNDTCQSVAAAASDITGTRITTTQLQSFNPELGTTCQLMASKVGQTICLTPNGGFPSVAATSSGNPSSTPTSKAAVPTPTAPGTTGNCGRFYLVREGDICNTVTLNNSVSLDDFLIMNPEVNTNCTNLWLGYNYCVAPYPPLQSSSAVPVVTTNYSTATLMMIPLTTASYTPTLITVALTPAGIPAPTNVASGTRTIACGYYYDVQTGDTLDSISATVGVSAFDLLTWNPELANSSPINGTALCVLFPTGNYTLNDAPVPTNVAANTTTECAQYYTVQSGDGCPSIETEFGITDAQFKKMNPSINAQCTNILLGVAYCVFPDTPFAPPSDSDIPGNVAQGTITEGCTKYYTVVSGDSCAVIESEFNVTLAQFISFNPEINSQCTNLGLGSAYCVASSNATSTGPPPNVAPGTITDGCTDYHTVVSGDSCSVIETTFNLTLAQFIAMNPEINSQCTNLILGDAYCVHSSNGTTSTGPPTNLATGSLANCTTYHTVLSGDNCNAIDAQYSIAEADFLRWNPEVDVACTQILAGEAYCVGGGGNQCQKIYTVKGGDSCFAITQSQGITQAQLNALNPNIINADCSNISPGQNLCVG